VPKPGPKELLVKVAAVGICAGDAKCYAGADRFWGKEKLPQCTVLLQTWPNCDTEDFFAAPGSIIYFMHCPVFVAKTPLNQAADNFF
jgi:hypothetical protein